MLTRLRLPIVAAYVCYLGAACAADNTAPQFNQVHFQVERSRSVDNDRMQTILSIAADDDDTARLADKINSTMKWALALTKAQPTIETRSGNYQTYQTYEKNAKRWRTTQELVLESADFALMSSIVGKLQERLQVTSMSFFVSPERHTKIEDELIAQALNAFRQRAELVRTQLKSASYRIVDVSINTMGAQPPRPTYQFARTAAASVESPGVEAGTGKIAVTVSGAIELQ